MIITIERNNIPILDIRYIQELPAIGLLRIWFKDGTSLDINVASKAAREAYLAEYDAKYEQVVMKQAAIVGEIYAQTMIESFEASLTPPLPKNLH